MKQMFVLNRFAAATTDRRARKRGGGGEKAHRMKTLPAPHTQYSRRQEKWKSDDRKRVKSKTQSHTETHILSVVPRSSLGSGCVLLPDDDDEVRGNRSSIVSFSLFMQTMVPANAGISVSGLNADVCMN